MFLFCLVFAMFCARLFMCALWSPAGINTKISLNGLYYITLPQLFHGHGPSSVLCYNPKIFQKHGTCFIRMFHVVLG